jgi:hypothetical protein
VSTRETKNEATEAIPSTGRPACVRRGHLDHHVGPVEPLPQLDRLRDRAGGVVGEVGRALEGDEAVAPIRGVVRRPQEVGGASHVFERQLEEQLLGALDTPASRSACRRFMYV